MAIGLALVSLVVVGGLVAVATLVLGGGDPEPGDAVAAVASDITTTMADQEEMAVAIAEADVEAIEELRRSAPAPTTVELDVESTGSLNRSGVAAYSFPATAGEGYTISAALDGSDDVVGVAALPADGPVVAPADVVDAAVDGPLTVVLAVPERAGAALRVTVKAIEITTVDVTVDEVIDGELVEPGDVAEYRVEAEETDPYIVDMDNPDLTVAVVDPEGASIDLTTDPTVDLPRFETTTTGTYKVRVTGGTEQATGAFSIEIFKVPDYYFFYDSDDPELVIDTTVDTFQPLVNGDDNRAHVCLYLREGITMDLEISPTEATLDLGIDVFDETESGPLVARVNTHGPGVPETWSVTADDDVIRCFQLWGVDYTGGGFEVDFTTEG